MTNAVEREARAISKLLRVARLRAEELSGRVGMMQVALDDADQSLRRLADSVRREEAAATQVIGPRHLAAYLDGANKKRVALETTKLSLAREIDAARRDVEEAFAEMKKFEHLADRLDANLAEARRKKEAGNAEAAATMRFGRNSPR